MLAMNLGWFEYDREAVPLLREGRYVYSVRTAQPIKYDKGDSRVAYIGKTVTRAGEALSAMGEVLGHYMHDRIGPPHFGAPLGVTLLDVGEHLSPDDVEPALIFLFHERYGEAPRGNDPRVGAGKKLGLKRVVDSGQTTREELIALILALG